MLASWRMRCSPPLRGICPSCRTLSAASPIQAIRVVLVLVLVLVRTVIPPA
jgi:hypothetical protein